MTANDQDQDEDAAEDQPRLSARRRRAVLAVTCLGLLMVVAAVASLNVALPSVSRSTGATQTQLQWIVDAYALVLAGLLLPAGALGDRYGRKGTLLTGLLIFGSASAFAMFVNQPTALIASRAVIGLGAALVMPTTLSIITNVFPADERPRAVAVWAGVAGGGAVLGLLVSGGLLRWFSWPSVFAINVVLAVLALVLTLPIVPKSRSSRPTKLDPVGALLSASGLATLVFSIIEAPSRGWLDTVTVVGLIVGGLLLAAFVLFELRRDEPMLDPRLFAHRGFGVGSLSLTLQFFAQFGLLFVSLQYLQLVLDYSPLQAGLAILPMAAMLMIISPRTPKLVHRLGVRLVGSVGLTLMAGGFVVLSTLNSGSSYWQFASGAVLTGLGLALATAPATTAIVSSLPPGQQGIASAVNDLSREVGGAFGIAILGTILNSGYRDKIDPIANLLPHAASAPVKDSLAGALQIASQSGRRGPALVNHAQRAFVSGFSSALFVGACVLLLAAALVALLAPKHEDTKRAERPEADRETSPHRTADSASPRPRPAPS